MPSLLSPPNDELFETINNNYALAHKALLMLIAQLAIKAEYEDLNEVQKQMSSKFLRDLFYDIWLRWKTFPDKEKIEQFISDTQQELRDYGITKSSDVVIFVLTEIAGASDDA